MSDIRISCHLGSESDFNLMSSPTRATGFSRANSVLVFRVVSLDWAAKFSVGFR